MDGLGDENRGSGRSRRARTGACRRKTDKGKSGRQEREGERKKRTAKKRPPQPQSKSPLSLLSHRHRRAHHDVPHGVRQLRRLDQQLHMRLETQDLRLCALGAAVRQQHGHAGAEEGDLAVAGQGAAAARGAQGGAVGLKERERERWGGWLFCDCVFVVVIWCFDLCL